MRTIAKTLFGLIMSAALCAGAAQAQHNVAGKTATFGFSGWSVAYLPTAIALDRLNAMGYAIRAVELGSNGNQLQAFARSAIDIAAIAQVLDVMDQGLDARFFLAGNVNEFLLVGKTGMTSCNDLHGKTLGIHSASSFVGQLALQYMARECPQAKANILVIEGSENRLAALINGQLDASVIDLQDWTMLNEKLPGRFVVTSDFTQTLPIMRVAFAARRDFFTSHPDLVRDWVKVHLDVYRELYQSPDILVQKGRQLLPEVDPAMLPKLVQAFVRSNIWPIDGGLSPTAVQQTLDFFNRADDPFKRISRPDQVADRSILDAVLAQQ